MEIIFDETNIGASGDPTSKENKPAQKIERFKGKLEKLGKFIGADKIEYQDHGKREMYILTKGEERLTLIIEGNQFDGGYLTLK